MFIQSLLLKERKKEMKTGSMGFFPVFSLACLLVFLISTGASKAALVESRANSTTYDETIADQYIEGEEEVQRVLAGYPPRYISYGSLEKPPICNANIYGNCIKPIGKNDRPCTAYTRCKRGINK